jgi:hypothetical protein
MSKENVNLHTYCIPLAWPGKTIMFRCGCVGAVRERQTEMEVSVKVIEELVRV